MLGEAAPESERPRLYIESSILSYLTARPSRDIITAAHQQITRDWWEDRRSNYELYASQAVVVEASAGNPEAAAQRLEALRGITILQVTEEAINLADALMERVPLPDRASVDATHIAVASVNGMDYLLTWNCTHIANGILLPRIRSVCESAGIDMPLILTPEQLMES